jgi:recombination protein RecA
MIKNPKKQSIVDKIEKRFGRETLIKKASINKDVFSSGSLGLDIILGIGGYPSGRIIEIYGPEASGKTTLALHAILEVQKRGNCSVFIDMEHAVDLNYIKNIGIDLSKLLLSQPNNGEQALEIATFLTQTRTVSLIIVDSVASLVPKYEFDKCYQDVQIGLHARLMSRVLRKLSILTSKNNVSIIFINQIRLKIGVLFGSNETTTGGTALKFYASIRIEIKRIGNLKKANDIIGCRTKIKITKNKLSSPFKEIEFDILYGLGVSNEGELMDLGTKTKVLKKNGNWITYDSCKLGYGRENVRFYILRNSKIAYNIYNDIISISFYIFKKNVKKKLIQH